MTEATNRQQSPTDGSTDVLPLVISDLQDRSLVGQVKYGKTLQTSNGRDALIDAYQEALDLCMYLRQLIEERKHEVRIMSDDGQDAAWANAGRKQP
jgi:hypothetical protein